MMRSIERLAKRLVWLALIVGAAALTARWWSTRSVPQPSADPSWPPFETRPAQAPAAATPAAPAPTTAAPIAPAAALGATRWVLPLDGGACPNGYPIKANDNSGIYHVPGGRSYTRTKAERCYVDAESAAADGYRAAKA